MAQPVSRAVDDGPPVEPARLMKDMEAMGAGQDERLANDMLRTKTSPTSPELIAPCGINCRLCHAYVRDKNACPGCRFDDAHKPKSCVMCRIKNCVNLGTGEIAFCFTCDGFPCARLAHLDKRYRTRYGTNVIANLRSIQNAGLQNFIESENEKWTCPRCGDMLCMHKPACLSCGYAWLD
jgi:hypothetical protein